MKRVILSFVFALAAFQPAWADRAPTPAERFHVEATLRGAGFVRWEDIELADGRWDVEEAVALDGRVFHLKLDPYTLAIVEMEPD
jgi:hypothetical protein